LLLGIAVAMAALGCTGETTSQIPAVAPTEKPLASDERSAWFRDVTADSGIDFTYVNGEEMNRFTLLESLGGGVGFIDYDRDGWLDVVLPGGGVFETQGTSIHGRPTRLFRNLANGKFSDVSGECGLSGPEFYSHGCAVADYDRDGWPDFAITGYGRLALYHNEDNGRGKRTFVEVTRAAGLSDELWSTGAAWGDIDGNGYADLFVCHYADWSFENDPFCARKNSPDKNATAQRDVCPPQRFRPQPSALWLNRGDGTFRDAAGQQSLRADGYGLGVLVADLDRNGQPDIYVGNDVTANFLYTNHDGSLEERGLAAGVALDENGEFDGSMGVDAGDWSGSGQPSLWVTNFQDELHALYVPSQGGMYYHDSKASGIAALGRRYVGFGTGFIDADNDGWEDLVIANGHVLRFPVGSSFRQRAVLLHNVERGGRRFFENKSAAGGSYFEQELLGRGLAVGDLDNDGWPDLVVSHSNSPVVLLKNQGGQIPRRHWLGVELAGRHGRDVAGATAVLEVAGRQLTRLAKGGGSYLSSGDRRLLFGLGEVDRGEARQTGRLTVHWPWGQIQHWENLLPDAYYRVREGEANPERLSYSLP
jgi:hypothetical protein